MKSTEPRGLGRRAKRVFFSAIALLGAGVIAGVWMISPMRSASAPASSHSKTKGFVVSRFFYPVYTGDNECPEGLALGADRAEALKRHSPAERARLQRPENNEELSIVMRHRGAFGMDVCDNPELVPDPGFRTVQGKKSFGLNLDGLEGDGPGTNVCAHENFISPSGERGIDNQWYRVSGCIKTRRPGGPIYDSFDAGMRQGDFTILIEITGVDDVRNDDDVQVGFYSSKDAMITNPNNGELVLTHASFQLHSDPNYGARTRGKIVNGVLTTEPVNVLLESPGDIFNFNLRDARVRMELKEDGTATGMLGAYQEVEAIYRALTRFPLSEDYRGPITCPGLFRALQRMADAYPDRNGACTWISAAFQLEAVPAFIIHPKGKAPGVNSTQASRNTASGSKAIL